MIREIEKDDLQKLLELYTHLHDNPLPPVDSRINDIWSNIFNNPGHYILLGFIEEKLIVSCVINIIENLTRTQRPYAVIENVITHPDYRMKGYASVILAKAKEIAEENNCYKIMLLTGSKEESIHNFYRKAGFNSQDKTAFIIRYS
ncbi:MAG: GNAT family N-acetyltransferase [Lachnospiraceae bacterium]|nr:GNAT family N-acetyltransferase [Lachnospiraceae bacterium]